MINPQELIQDYVDQGYTKEEAVANAKVDLHNKKVYTALSNKEQLIKRLNNPATRLSEQTNRAVLRKTNHSS